MATSGLGTEPYQARPQRQGGKYHAALRALDVLGSNFQDLRLTDVARTLNTSAGNALRSLENLRAAGPAERDPVHKDTWLLGPRVVQIGLAFERYATDAANKLTKWGLGPSGRGT